MTQFNDLTDNEQEDEVFPVAPHYHPIHKLTRAVYDFFASAKLAMFLLVVILACCVTGVTVIRDPKAGELIFRTLWFNGLLVLLVINVACCFFGRIWGRRVTLISLGMILFHLSFVSILCGIVYNSLFYFRGVIRLTEGETLPSGDVSSYDFVDKGRFFNFTRLKGGTSLIKMHTGYRVAGDDKRAAYEIAVGEGASKKQDTIYITHNLEYRGFKYFPDREGYSVLTVLFDKTGKEIYGAHIPLQSLMQNNSKNHFYTSGTKEGAGILAYPQQPLQPLFDLNVSYYPDPNIERGGEAEFRTWPHLADLKHADKPNAEGRAAIGAKYRVGDYELAVKEVRYWTAMTVRYEPGQPIVMVSLWVALFGVTLTTLARMLKKRKVVDSVH